MATSLNSAPGGPRRILLVDDHPVTRNGIRTLIESEAGFATCAEAANASAALQLLKDFRPDAAIIDISLNGGNGLDLVPEFQRAVSPVPVLIVSMHDEEFYAARAQRAGAAGYVMKQHASDRIMGALRRILAGQTAFAENAVVGGQRSAALKKSARIGLEYLSDRETEVLRLIGDGYSTREIAQELKLSAKTIDTYREHLKRKLDLVDGERLVRFAVQWANSTAKRLPQR